MKGKLCRVRDIQRGSQEDNTRVMGSSIILKRKMPMIVRILVDGEVVSVYYFEGTGVGSSVNAIEKTKSLHDSSRKPTVNTLFGN